MLYAIYRYVCIIQKNTQTVKTEKRKTKTAAERERPKSEHIFPML